MKSISSAPVTISVMVPAVDRAPLVSFDWLFFSASMAVSVALWIWSLLKCDSRPVLSEFLALAMLRATWSINAGAPWMNWLTTKVRMPPTTTMLLRMTRATAAPLASPRRSR